MSAIDSIIRRSAMVDTSGAYTPPAIQANIQQAMGGGVYTQGMIGGSGPENVLSGQISLGFVGALIVIAVAFYLWTHEIQGGG